MVGLTPSWTCCTKPELLGCLGVIWENLAFLQPNQEQLSARVLGGNWENSVYVQGSHGWRHPPQPSHLTHCFGNHEPKFARKALERHREGGGCHGSVENQGICSQGLDDSGFSILVACNHLVHFK